MKENLRTPIVCVMGHVDHGKTTLLDKIRGTSIASKESGFITQHIGATEISINSIIKKCGDNNLKKKFFVPGLLFIDTPGHHAFTTLRRRGGSLADLAVVIIDINEGFKPQTIESLNILKRFKTPFLIVANKIDKINGWKKNNNYKFLDTYKLQDDNTKFIFENKIYDIIGKLYEYGFTSERFDKIKDFRRTVGIIPASSLTGEGIEDILLVLLGLSQKFLESNLKYNIDGPGVGTVLEVKEERGLGTTIDVILYDGTLKKGDTIIIGSINKPIETKIRALFKPKQDIDINYETKFKQVSKVTAASGIKIVAQGIENALSGSTLYKTTPENINYLRNKLKEEINDIQMKMDIDGIHIKADTIGSLEALVYEFKKMGVKIRKAEIGSVTKHDIMELSSINNKYYSIIIAFNVKINNDVLEIIDQNNYKIFSSDIIYQLLDDYENYIEHLKKIEDLEYSENISYPSKLIVLKNCIFRQSKPAVFGVKILSGTIKNNTELSLSNGNKGGLLKGIELNGKKIQSASSGMEVSIAVDGITIGKQLKEEDILYSTIPEKDVKVLETKIFEKLTYDQKEVLNEYTSIKRRENPFWGK